MKKQANNQRMKVRLAAALIVLTSSAGLWGQPAAPAPPPPPASGTPAPPPAPPAPRMKAFSYRASTTRAYLGVGVAEISAQRSRELKLSEERGVEVTRVAEDSPAAKAGIKEGDVILEYNGQRIEGVEQFMRMVRETPPNRQVRLLVSRGGATQTLTATLGERKGIALPGNVEIDVKEIEKELGKLRRLEDFDFRIRIPDIPRPQMTWRSRVLGVEAESLGDSQLAEFFGVKEGVLVRSVLEGSPAAKAGIKAGDVIVKIEDRKVTTPGEISSILREMESKKTVNVTLMRRQKEMTLAVPLEEKAERPAVTTVSIVS